VKGIDTIEAIKTKETIEKETKNRIKDGKRKD
jgi:hypothetical protein